MKAFVSSVVGAALVAGLTMTPPMSAQAAPLSVAPASTVQPATALTDVRYKKKRVVRHYRRGYGNNNAAAAAAFGLFGAALAGAIASSRYDDGYYYNRGYAPAYGYNYGYASPRAYYAPGFRGGYRGGFRGGHGGWNGGHGGWHGGHRR